MKQSGLTARIIVITGLQLLLGCTVGPDYVRPKAVETLPGSYKEIEGWKIAEPEAIIHTQLWWEIFEDSDLNELAAQVSISNLNVAIAESRFRQARYEVKAAQSGRFPTLFAGAAATRARSSENLGDGSTVSSFQLPLDFSWELDLWGRVRREIEASQSNAQASAADLAAITLTAQAELAGAYFQLRVLDAQKRLLEKTQTVYRKSLDIANYRYEAGATTGVDALQAETQLKNIMAQIIDLGLQRARLEHAISLLIGKNAGEISLSADALSFTLPDIPPGIPSELLERRPDIAAAERRMAEANARIGLAQAAFYPAVQLSASGGFGASSFADWLAWPSRFWSFGPVASVNLFDGGLRQARKDQSFAAYDEVVASYRLTVLSAFKEVEDNLAALRILEKEAEVQAQVIESAQKVVEITSRQYEAGTVGYLDVLVAQAIALTSERTALDIFGRRLSASILLVKALGGDWQNLLQN